MTQEPSDAISLDSKNGYSITSHGGIGDELGEDPERERPKHNLSGSCHKLQIQIGGQVLKILVDVGGYQGRGKLERNIHEISGGVSAIILTHPHMDHIGDFPRIFTEGSEFNGRVFSSSGTRQAAEIALIDAAKILQREYEKKHEGWKKTTQEIAEAFYVIRSTGIVGEKKVARRSNGNRVAETGSIVDRSSARVEAKAILEKYGITLSMRDTWRAEMKDREPEKPAYTLDDVYTALSSIETHGIKNGWKDLVPGQVAFRFYNAGHIIGSVSVLFRLTHQKKSKYVLFSGDLGSYKWDMHPTGVATPPHNLPIDTVMIESTYGAKVREDFAVGLADFETNLIRDLGKYRRVTISTFAMDRTQNILARLIKMKLAGRIDADIILDSPAGTKHTQAYVRETQDLDELLIPPKAPGIRNLLGANFDERERLLLEEFVEYIDPANGHYQIADKDNREEIFADTGKKKIVLTASGMADGGMVISHLQTNIEDPTTVFYFPGYLVPGTLGYALANKDQPGGQQKRVTIEGDRYEVKARMKQFNFLSGHGDAEDLRAWLSAMKLPKGANIRIVHGDVNGSSLEFAHSLERHGGFADTNIIVPQLEEENFFPFDIVELKKGEKGRKIARGPLTIEPAPARTKILPPKETKTIRIKSKKPPVQKGVEKVDKGTVKIGGKARAEKGRYTHIFQGIHSEYMQFRDDILSLPFPFLAKVIDYYTTADKVENIEDQLASKKTDLRVHQRKLFELQNPKEGKGTPLSPEDLASQSTQIEEKISESTSTITLLQTTLAEERQKLEGRGRISAQELSKGIIESMGYATSEIPPRSEIVSLISGDDIHQVVIDTIIKIVKMTEEDDSLFSKIVKVSALKSDAHGLFGEKEKEALSQLESQDIKTYLEGTIISLISKIQPEYVLKSLTKRQKTVRSKVSPQKNAQKAGVSTVRETPIRNESPQSIEDTLTKELTILQKKQKKYIQYYTERIDALQKDKMRLETLIQVKTSENKPSRGKYMSLSLEELWVELKNNGSEIRKVTATSKKQDIIDDPTEYEDIVKKIKEVLRKIARKK